MCTYERSEVLGSRVRTGWRDGVSRSMLTGTRACEDILLVLDQWTSWEAGPLLCWSWFPVDPGVLLDVALASKCFCFADAGAGAAGDGGGPAGRPRPGTGTQRLLSMRLIGPRKNTPPQATLRPIYGRFHHDRSASPEHKHFSSNSKENGVSSLFHV